MTDWQNSAAGGKPPAASASGGEDSWPERPDPPLYSVTLWPNRSLTPGNRRVVMRILAFGLAIPLVPTFGTPVFWGLLPFAIAAWVALWVSFRRSDADARLHEALAIWPDEMRVERHDPDGRVRRWRADPYFVRLTLHADGRPEQYLTMTGGGREIELGAFLSPEERVDLAAEIEEAIRRALVASATPGGGDAPAR